MSAYINPTEVKEALKSEKAWKAYTPKLKELMKPTNQAAADWWNIENLYSLLNTKYSDFEHASDKNQYESSMADIQNIIAGNGTIGQLLESAKYANSASSNARKQASGSSKYSFDPVTGAVISGDKTVSIAGVSGQQTPFSGTLTEGKVVSDNQGNYFKYSNGQWQTIDKAQYDSGTNKTIIAPQEGNWIKAQMGQTGETGTTGQSGIPDELSNDPIFQSMSEQEKKLVMLNYDVQTAIKTGDAAKMQDAQAAIDRAIKAADPYFKSKIILAKDEIERSISKLTGEYESNLSGYENKIKQLKEDLIFNKEQLTLEQQQEMSDQLKDYQNKLYNTQQQMAESGLAFSSPRTTAEANLLGEQQGIAQSTQRKYAQAFREQELNQQRQTLALQQNISDLERKKKEGLTDVARKGEEYLGSTNVPSVSGVSPLGGITGELSYQRGSAIKSLAEGEKNWADIFNF